MEQAKLLTKSLRKNSNNPRFAWLLFKRTIMDPDSHVYLSQNSSSIRHIVLILVQAKMFSEIQALHTHLLLVDEVPRYFLVKILAQSGYIDQAMPLFQSLRTHFRDKPPSISLYNLLIKTSLKHMCRTDYLSWLYKDVVFSRVKLETYTFNLLFSWLCDSNRLDDARELFDRMHVKGCEPNEFSFGILVHGYCKLGFSSEALGLLDLMRKRGLTPNAVIYNTLIACFSKEDNNEDAEKLVERMKDDGIDPNVVTFNIRISALCNAGRILEASRIFWDMQTDEMSGLPKPNALTYNMILKGFLRQGMLAESKALIDSIKKNDNFYNIRICNTLLHGFLSNGKILEAQEVLSEMVDDGLEPNEFSYNILIDGFCKNDMLSDAKTLLNLLKTHGISPDTVTYTTVLQGYCMKRKTFEANNVLHDMINGGCLPNTYTFNILLHSLWKEGKTDEAERLLQMLNEIGAELDTVSCNIVLAGLCKSGKVDQAVEILSEMWNHGSDALNTSGNLYFDLVRDNNHKFFPDLISYSTIINCLCKGGRLDEAKKKFVEMLGRNLFPDSVIYDIFLYNLCKRGKVQSAFQVLKDMEKKGCSKNLQTYNSLIMGLGAKKQIFEMFGLMDEMKENGIDPNVHTYNHVLGCLSEEGKSEESALLLDEMLQKEITPNMYFFKMLIETFCRAGEFRPAQEAFQIAVSVCGDVDVLYQLMFNELLSGGQISEAMQLLESAVEKFYDLRSFQCRDLINSMCMDGNPDLALGILDKMVQRKCKFEPASFMPAIDYLIENGNKHRANLLNEKMLDMISKDERETKVSGKDMQLNSGRQCKDGSRIWENTLLSDDGSAIATRTLQRVKRGWGHSGLSNPQVPQNDFLGEWDVVGQVS